MSLAGRIKTTSEAPKRKPKQLEAKQEKQTAGTHPGDTPEMASLRERSQAAALQKPILVNQKTAYEVEQKKLQLELAAGNIMTFEQGNFLFFGFFKKASRDWQRVGKRNKPILKNLVQEGDLDGVLKLYDEEITAIIKGLKIEQKKVVDEWKRDLKEQNQGKNK